MSTREVISLSERFRSNEGAGVFWLVVDIVVDMADDSFVVWLRSWW